MLRDGKTFWSETRFWCQDGETIESSSSCIESPVQVGGAINFNHGQQIRRNPLWTVKRAFIHAKMFALIFSADIALL